MIRLLQKTSFSQLPQYCSLPQPTGWFPKKKLPTGMSSKTPPGIVGTLRCTTERSKAVWFSGMKLICYSGNFPSGFLTEDCVPCGLQLILTMICGLYTLNLDLSQFWESEQMQCTVRWGTSRSTSYRFKFNCWLQEHAAKYAQKKLRTQLFQDTEFNDLYAPRHTCQSYNKTSCTIVQGFIRI